VLLLIKALSNGDKSSGCDRGDKKTHSNALVQLEMCMTSSNDVKKPANGGGGGGEKHTRR
jgi:hypothetical protein